MSTRSFVGQFINLYPTRREAVAYLTGKDAE
jgi:hypothetical protein